MLGLGGRGRDLLGSFHFFFFFFLAQACRLYDGLNYFLFLMVIDERAIDCMIHLYDMMNIVISSY